MRKKSVYYIIKDELRTELEYYKKTKIISEKLGEMILKIAHRYSSKPCFSGYSYRDEFVSEAIYRMIDQLDMSL